MTLALSENEVIHEQAIRRFIRGIDCFNFYTLDQLAAHITNWNVHQGFWLSDNFGEKVSLIHSELGEATEAHRKGLTSDHVPELSGEEEEFADAIIRILDLCGHKGYRIGFALEQKLKYNTSRPHKHGKLY